jgi:hypothetical protein
LRIDLTSTSLLHQDRYNGVSPYPSKSSSQSVSYSKHSLSTYLIEKGSGDEASLILARLHSTTASPDNEDVVFQRKQIEDSLEIGGAGGSFKYKKLLQGGKLFIAYAANLIQQFTGSNMINYLRPSRLRKNHGPIPEPVPYPRRAYKSYVSSIILHPALDGGESLRAEYCLCLAPRDCVSVSPWRLSCSALGRGALPMRRRPLSLFFRSFWY